MNSMAFVTVKAFCMLLFLFLGCTLDLYTLIEVSDVYLVISSVRYPQDSKENITSMNLSWKFPKTSKVRENSSVSRSELPVTQKKTNLSRGMRKRITQLRLVSIKLIFFYRLVMQTKAPSFPFIIHRGTETFNWLHRDFFSCTARLKRVRICMCVRYPAIINFDKYSNYLIGMRDRCNFSRIRSLRDCWETREFGEEKKKWNAEEKDPDFPSALNGSPTAKPDRYFFFCSLSSVCIESRGLYFLMVFRARSIDFDYSQRRSSGFRPGE